MESLDDLLKFNIFIYNLRPFTYTYVNQWNVQSEEYQSELNHENSDLRLYDITKDNTKMSAPPRLIIPKIGPTSNLDICIEQK